MRQRVGDNVNNVSILILHLFVGRGLDQRFVFRRRRMGQEVLLPC